MPAHGKGVACRGCCDAYRHWGKSYRRQLCHSCDMFAQPGTFVFKLTSVLASAIIFRYWFVVADISLAASSWSFKLAITGTLVT